MSAFPIDLILGAAAIAALAAGAAGWLRAAAPLLSGSSLERKLDAALILAWLAIGFFYLLAGAGLFRLWIAVAVVAISGLGLSRLRRGSSATPPEPAEAALRAPDLSDRWLWAALPVLGVVAVRAVKGMASPPLTWDAMTMHLPKAAFWIQSASLQVPDFPDAWAYYRWFPAAGEILFAWVMLPFSSDLLLGPLGTLIWLAILLAGARLGRLLGAGQRVAWLAGAALAALPSVIVFMTANYVDNLVLFFVISAVTHAILFARTSAPRHALLTLAAAGLAAGTKTSALAVMAPLVATLLVLVWRRRSELGSSPALLASGMSAALVVPCVGYFHTWLHTGSPFYPFKAPLLDLPHHRGLADLFGGRGLLPPGTDVPLVDVLSRLFWTPPAGQEHMNFGLGGVLLAVTALAGLVKAFQGRRLVGLWLTLSGAIVSTPLVFSESNLALLTLWVGVLGRHLLPAFAPIALWAAAAPERGARATLAASLLAGMVHQFHLGWSTAMVRPALGIALGLAVAGGVYLGLRRLPALAARTTWRRAVGAAIALLFLTAWSGLRDAARFSIYRETSARGGAFDAHPSHTTFAMGASLWPLLDTPKSLRLAVTVGKDQIGHNQFFYPLMGSRLQNRLVYVPLVSGAADRALEPDARYAQAVPARWLDNLEASGADLVVGLWPATPEREWLVSARNEFEITAFTSLGLPWVAQRAGAKHLAIPAGDGPP